MGLPAGEMRAAFSYCCTLVLQQSFHTRGLGARIAAERRQEPRLTRQYLTDREKITPSLSKDKGTQGHCKGQMCGQLVFYNHVIENPLQGRREESTV